MSNPGYASGFPRQLKVLSKCLFATHYASNRHYTIASNSFGAQSHHYPSPPSFPGPLTPSKMLATANKVDGEISSSFPLMEARRLSAVSLSPSLTSQNLSVLAVHSTITYTTIKSQTLNRCSIKVLIKGAKGNGPYIHSTLSLFFIYTTVQIHVHVYTQQEKSYLNYKARTPHLCNQTIGTCMYVLYIHSTCTPICENPARRLAVTICKNMSYL